MAGKKESVYMDRWLSFHPDKKPAHGDFYYLRLCSEVYGLLEADDLMGSGSLLSREELKNLACFIICYFEDVISGPGLWRAFTVQVSELYGTYLPSFPLDPDDYYPDEINLEDVQFLIWYFISMTQYEENVISPAILEESELPYRIFDILEREYESAPENPGLKELFAVGAGETDFFVLKEKMRWIMLDSWLLHFQMNELQEMIDKVLAEEKEEDLPWGSRNMYVYDTIDTYVLSTCTPLLARRGKDWLAYLAGTDHPLFRDILEIGEKKAGFYLFIGEESGKLLFRHIATEKVLEVTRESMVLPEGLRAGKSISFAGFVKWRDEWWFSGAQLVWDYSEDLVRNEKESGKSRMLFGEDPVVKKAATEQQYASFLEFNGGKPLAFVENGEKAGIFIREFMLFHNESLDVPDLEKKKAMEMIFRTDFTIRPDENSAPAGAGSIPGMIFFNRESGIQTAFGFNDLVPDPDNHWYREEEAGEMAIRLLSSPYISGDWMHYLADNYDIPGLDFPGDGGKELLMENLDFMLRFWKRKGYYP